MRIVGKAALAWILALSILTAGCFKSKNVVKRIPPANGKSMSLDGVPYALPRTVVKVTIPFTRVDKSPGEFEPYTPCFFSPAIAAGRIRAESKSFKINPPTFGSRGEPDPNEHYIAKIKGGYFENKTMALEFNDDGVITKGDMSSENVAIDVAIKAARTAISVGAALASPVGAADASKAAQKLKLDGPRIDICRSIILAEAAAIAAASAKEAADASASGVAAAAANLAADYAKAAEQEIASAQGEFTNTLSAVESKTADNVMVTTLVGNVTQTLDRVVCYANLAKQQTQAASVAAAAAAAEEAAAASKAAAKIDDALKFIGMIDDTTHPLAGFAGCYQQKPSGTPATAAFATGFVQAKEKFDRISALTKSREELIGGSTAPQGLSADALKKMLEELDTTISSYQNTFFLGAKESANWSGDFEFRPGKSEVSVAYNTFQTSPVLLTFTKSDGICATSESKAQGVKINPNFVAKCPLAPAAANAVWLSVTRLPADDAYLGHMAAANLRDEKNGERGFYYRIPAKALIKLETANIPPANMTLLDLQSDRGRAWRSNVPNEAPPAGPFFVPVGDELGRENMRVAQIGVVASIPASAAGRKTQYTIDFDESTGALKNFKLASNALLEKGLSDEISGAAKDVLDAKQARDKARKDAKDPLTQKKKELELLQTENAIEEEKKKKANSPQP